MKLYVARNARWLVVLAALVAAVFVGGFWDGPH